MDDINIKTFLKNTFAQQAFVTNVSSTILDIDAWRWMGIRTHPICKKED